MTHIKHYSEGYRPILPACSFDENSIQEPETQDHQKQKECTEKLDIVFDISHVNSNELIQNEEDRQFLNLQETSRTRCSGSADSKTLSVIKKRTISQTNSCGSCRSNCGWLRRINRMHGWLSSVSSDDDEHQESTKDVVV